MRAEERVEWSARAPARRPAPCHRASVRSGRVAGISDAATYGDPGDPRRHPATCFPRPIASSTSWSAAPAQPQGSTSRRFRPPGSRRGWPPVGEQGIEGIERYNDLRKASRCSGRSRNSASGAGSQDCADSRHRSRGSRFGPLEFRQALERCTRSDDRSDRQVITQYSANPNVTRHDPVPPAVAQRATVVGRDWHKPTRKRSAEAGDPEANALTRPEARVRAAPDSRAEPCVISRCRRPALGRRVLVVEAVRWPSAGEACCSRPGPASRSSRSRSRDWLSAQAPIGGVDRRASSTSHS